MNICTELIWNVSRNYHYEFTSHEHYYLFGGTSFTKTLVAIMCSQIPQACGNAPIIAKSDHPLFHKMMRVFFRYIGHN